MQSVMVGTLSLYELFAYFLIYAFLGWVVEVAFHAITQGKFVNRGFLNGPLCPIYGVGVVVILLLLGEHVEKLWLVFLVGVALPTLIELITGWLLEVCFHARWWDYSDRKCNFKGYICLEFSLLWGLAVVFVIAVVHPAVRFLAELLHDPAASVVVGLLLAALLADLVITVLQVLKLNRKLKEIDEAAEKLRAGSNFVGEHVAAAVLVANEAVRGAKEAIDTRYDALKQSVGARSERLREEWNARVDAIVAKMPKRILRAFPHLRSRISPDSVPFAQEGMRRLSEKKKHRKDGQDGDKKD